MLGGLQKSHKMQKGRNYAITDLSIKPF